MQPPYATRDEVQMLKEMFDARMTDLENDVSEMRLDVKQVLGWMQGQVAAARAVEKEKKDRKDDGRWLIGFIVAAVVAAVSITYTLTELAHPAHGAPPARPTAHIVTYNPSKIGTAVAYTDQRKIPEARPVKPKHPHDAYPLHVGSSGPRVCSLQWLLGGHKPNVFRAVQGTFGEQPTCYFGERTKGAVLRYKWRIGFPEGRIKTDTGAYFFALLLGHTPRPIMFVRNAAWRLKEVAPGETILAAKIKKTALSQLGVQEWPLGSNVGPMVTVYQAITGAYGAAWCVSFAQWVYVVAGFHTFADDSAGVYYVVGWAHEHGFLNAKPKVGALVAFLNNGGHMGIVIKVTAHGFVSVEGNASNRVLERFHTIGERPMVFVWIPGVTSP